MILQIFFNFNKKLKKRQFDVDIKKITEKVVEQLHLIWCSLV
jgi:hypothetical protein